ncbi:hypothetical protein SERLA73DRAFT_72973 [Serpula lacrymans var. lacrymans S7.3]|uniref:Rho-GAP domain-containing protein n=1 Tax=Serpula lacrymans var. lacrymans (strain S7.3) TaxID=936435 RepID=F8PW70_SERL3|nr:hypothetical protein SERLA73DRAFT_72973 [Serpula lacrymans var. lacrymans S7.3]
MSSASLSSSFSSSAASSMLLPAAPASNSSQSDIITSDHSASSPSTTTKTSPACSGSSALPRSPPPPPTPMGQVYSRPENIPPSPASSPTVWSGSGSTGSRFKRAFAGRRKKTDNIESSPVTARKFSRDNTPQSIALSSSAPPHATPRHQLGPKQLTLQLASHVFSKRHTSSPISPSSNMPPPPPPKSAVPRLLPQSINTSVDKRTSLMTSSPSIVAAIDYMRRVDEHDETGATVDKENSRKDGEKPDSKEARRKSDSTMSHHTIRPGFILGSRTSRPVSMADSLHSTHTIVPGHKRLSAFLTEAENTMPEEDDTERSYSKEYPPSRTMPSSQHTSPSSSIKVRNRRSKSLNLGGPLTVKVSPPEVTVTNASASLDTIPVHRTMSDSVPVAPPAMKELPALMREAGTGPIAPASSVSSSGHSGLQTRSNLAASPGARNLASPARQERNLPDLPPAPRRPSLAHTGQAPPTFRQTAISMSNGFAPAAGLARRAVEKMGRVWGARHTTTNSGYMSSSPTGSAPSSFSSGRSGPVSRSSSNHSDMVHLKKQRRTPQAPSGSWSINSTGTSSSLSDTEGFSMPLGPILGKRLRGPMRFTPGGAGVAGGLVFGRDLKTCVRDTAIEAMRTSISSLRRPTDAVSVSQSETREGKPRTGSDDSLENRRLPALVVRCAQHILVCGVQELGLFRVSGRSSHVAKLRTEFDTGADYDLALCNPGDLDPHAVASIFKAYLRELPEPILTHALAPYFEAAILTERNAQGPSQGNQPLPSSPKFGLRKPPSLSTLAMPVFAKSSPPSESLRRALSSLIARLPQENRDLLRTVTELINATASRSGDTKMPLSNLLLVLCPSLNMNPSLLQALCESEGLWDDGASSDNHTSLDNDDMMVDQVRNSSRSDDSAVAVKEETKALPDSMEMHSKVTESLSVEDETQDNAPSGGDVEDSARALPDIPVGEDPTSTLYVDCETSNDSLSSQSSPARKASSDSEVTTPESCEITPSLPSPDDTSSVSQSSQDHRPPTPTSANYNLSNPYSPPSLSSSAESLATPSTSSGSPSLPPKHFPLTDEFDKSEPSDSPRSPVIAEAIHLPLPSTPKKQTVQAQFQFPSTGGSVPSTPVTSRKFNPLLSLPSHSSLSQADALTSSSLASRAKRMKKPSLHLLFSKRSASPMPVVSPSVPSSTTSSTQQNFSQSYSSPSTSTSTSSPESMVTAPQSSRYSFPPILNTAIDSSSLRLSLGIDEDEEDADHDSSRTYDSGPTPKNSSFHQASKSNTSLATALETPIAQFNSSSTSLNSFTSGAPYRHLNVSISNDDKDDDDDWAQSVLMAADSEGGWSVNKIR